MKTYRNLNVALAALVLFAAGMSLAAPRSINTVRLATTAEGVPQIIVVGKRMNATQKVIYDVKAKLALN